MIIIEEAIKRLTVIEELMATDFDPQDSDAVHLGIEALKRHQAQVRTHLSQPNIPLLGETKSDG